jgi:CubicO group peptidase (beta-lactamase class C family)
MFNSRYGRFRQRALPVLLLSLFILEAGTALNAQDALVQKLQGFDARMIKLLKDWNAPGFGVGIVAGDKLIFAKGYGFRDYAKKLPFTETTLFQIASNTKLFTAVAAGMLVEEGKLTWDKPIRESVPSIRFFNDQLTDAVTLRDMLSHRSGISQYNSVWYQSDDTRQQLFDKLKYLEPGAPLRTAFIYSNLMYAATGHIIELLSGKSWENFVRERIFAPLGMTGTLFSAAEMRKQPDRSVPYTEKRDSSVLYEIPVYEDAGGVAPCGAIISNIRDISHWLIALLNDGRYEGRQVLPPAVLKATLEPAIPIPNNQAEARGSSMILNLIAGMGRFTAVYRGHALAFHDGGLPGFHSEISVMPKDKLGVIVFVLGEHCDGLHVAISYDVYERLLGMDLTPWSEWMRDYILEVKKAGAASRAKAEGDKVPRTQPSHALDAYAAEYEHPAYGLLKITQEGAGLQLEFHKIKIPLLHYHYDRFDTPDDERFGRQSINFLANLQGDIEKAVISLDGAEAVFVRKAGKPGPETLAALAGPYETPTGIKFQVVLKSEGILNLVIPGQTPSELVPYKGLRFRNPAFPNTVFEFVLENGRVRSLRQITASGEVLHTRR